MAPVGRALAARSEPERRQRVLHRVADGPAAGRARARGPPRARPARSRRGRAAATSARASQEASRACPCGASPPGRASAAIDPLVPRTAAGLHDRAPLEQPRLGEPLELEPDRVRVPPDALGQLLGGRRAEQLGEDRSRAAGAPAGRARRRKVGFGSSTDRRPSAYGDFFTMTREKVVGISIRTRSRRARGTTCRSPGGGNCWSRRAGCRPWRSWCCSASSCSGCSPTAPTRPSRPPRSGSSTRRRRCSTPASDIRKGQQVFLHNGLMEYGSVFGHGAYLGPGLHRRLPAPVVGLRPARQRRRRVRHARRGGRSRTSAPTATTSAPGTLDADGGAGRGAPAAGRPLLALLLRADDQARAAHEGDHRPRRARAS